MNNFTYYLLATILIILAVILGLMLSLGIVAGLFYLVCIGFGIVFTWVKAIAVWAVMVLIGMVVRK